MALTVVAIVNDKGWKKTLWMHVRTFIVLDLRKDMGNTLHLISAKDPKSE